jgi:hypothetical protein
MSHFNTLHVPICERSIPNFWHKNNNLQKLPKFGHSARLDVKKESAM